MRRGRFSAGLGVVAAASLLAATGAPGATSSSKQVYADYADNARLDRAYSSAELRETLKDAWVQGYGNPTVVTGLKPAIKTTIAKRRAAKRPAGVLGARVQQTAPGRAEARRSTLPFTGFDVALLTAGGGLLLLVGSGLRRLARDKR